MAPQTNMEAETFRHTNSGMLFVASSYVELRRNRGGKVEKLSESEIKGD